MSFLLKMEKLRRLPAHLANRLFRREQPLLPHEQVKGVRRAAERARMWILAGFSDESVRAEYGAHLPVVFMNSFHTRDDTVAQLAKYPDFAVSGIPAGSIKQSKNKQQKETSRFFMRIPPLFSSYRLHDISHEFKSLYHK